MKEFLIFLLLFSCDFTPIIYKEILKVQEGISKGKYLWAIEQYKNILKKNPPDDIKVKINDGIGDVYYIYLSNYKEALKHFKKAKKITKEYSWLVKIEDKISNIYFNYLDNYEESIKSYKKLISLRPKLKRHDFYLYKLAIAYKRNKLFDSSEEIFNLIKNQKKNKYSKDAYYYLGMIHFEKKNWKKAIFYWEEHLRREYRRDKFIETKFLIANVYETIEDLNKAYRIYYSILGEYPNTKVIQNRLDAIYSRRIFRKR